MWQNKTVLADEPEDKRPELAPIAMLFTIINAVLCLISLLLAFVPVHIEKSIINEKNKFFEVFREKTSPPPVFF